MSTSRSERTDRARSRSSMDRRQRLIDWSNLINEIGGIGICFPPSGLPLAIEHARRSSCGSMSSSRVLASQTKSMAGSRFHRWADASGTTPIQPHRRRFSLKWAKLLQNRVARAARCSLWGDAIMKIDVGAAIEDAQSGPVQ